ncbi:hypothetical protein C8T65DRAFT_748575 [Cerioporus squamosus]|nr:hypothetical protein C8T65DRAFT_748575 [Cerioporus squamosus]
MSPQLYGTYRAPTTADGTVDTAAAPNDSDSVLVLDGSGNTSLSHTARSGPFNPRGHIRSRNFSREHIARSVPMRERQRRMLAGPPSDPDEADVEAVRGWPRPAIRLPSTAVTAYNPYRAQGTSTADTVIDISTIERQVLCTSVSNQAVPSSSSDSSDNDSPPPLEPARVARPPRVLATGRSVTRLEQYLVVVLDGERFFFGVDIRIERTPEGIIRPSVRVRFMQSFIIDGMGVNNDAWLLFSFELENTLQTELERAFQWASDRQRDATN